MTSIRLLVVMALAMACAAAVGAADLSWIDLTDTNRPPAGVSSATAAMATCAVNASERDSAEFDLNTNPPGFCMVLR
jgi:hypothetical protein